MFGSPKDIEGECNAHLYIADNQGDGEATMRCQLPKGHEGVHREIFHRPDSAGEVVVTWEKDERCWHEWVEKDSEQALAFFIKTYEDEEMGKTAFENGKNWDDHTRVCIKCGEER